MQKIEIAGLNNITRKLRLLRVDYLMLGYIAIGFFIGRVALPSMFAPFAAAYLCALRSEERDNTLRVISAGIFIALGVATTMNTQLIFMQVLALLLSGAIYIVIKTFTDKHPPIFTMAITAAAAVFVSTSFLLMVDGATLAGFGFNLLQAITAFVLTCIFRIGLRVFSVKTITTEQLYSFFLLIALSTLAFYDVKVYGFSVINAVASLIIMVAASVGGVSMAAVAGLVMGVLCGLGGSYFAECIGIYGFCALFTGVMSRFYKPGIIIGFALSNALLTIMMNGGPSIFIIYEIILAAVLYSFLPKRLLIKLGTFVRQTESDEKLRRTKTSISKQIVTIAATLDKLAVSIASAKTPAETNSVTATALFDTVSEKVCTSCENCRMCWTKQSNETYNYLLKATPALKAKGRAEPSDLPTAFTEKCPKLTDYLNELNKLYQRHKLDALWQRKISESRQLACEQLDNVAQVMKTLSTDVMRDNVDADAPAKKYTISCAAITKSKGGEEYCGDCYTYMPLGEKYLVALSDGMGTGKEANLQSSLSLSFLEDFLSAGFDTLQALRLINSVLLLRSNEDTYATLDIALIDLANGDCEFIKLGANTTYIKRDKKVEQLTCKSLPAGILKRIEPQSASLMLEPGDYIIMMSDGVHSPLDNWAIPFLKSQPNSSPQILTDSIMKEAIKRHGDEITDDMCILVSKIC